MQRKPMQRQVLIGLASLLLSSGFAAAQGMAPQTVNPNNAETVPQHLGLETIVGCLSKYENGTFAIVGGNPGAKQFRIISGDVSSLKHADGQDVKVVGIVGKNDALANQNGLYNEGSTTGVGYLTIELQKVKVLGAHCGSSGKEWEGDHMNDGMKK